MQTVTKDEFRLRKDEFLDLIRQGAVFIYPTDTIYGIGCDATNSRAVHTIREIKARSKNPFSVIAPSKKWIEENCVSDSSKTREEWMSRLPGPYTLIFRLRNKKAIAEEVNNGSSTIGVRIPDHWFTEYAQESGMPIVTTSANFTGEYFMTSLDDLNPKIKGHMDFIIYEGEKKGRPSTLVNLSEDQPDIRTR